MQSKIPLTLPSPPRGEEIPLFASRLLCPPNSDSFSRGGLLPLPLGERIEVRGIVRRNCIVTTKVGTTNGFTIPMRVVKAMVLREVGHSCPTHSLLDSAVADRNVHPPFGFIVRQKTGTSVARSAADR